MTRAHSSGLVSVVPYLLIRTRCEEDIRAPHSDADPKIAMKAPEAEWNPHFLWPSNNIQGGFRVTYLSKGSNHFELINICDYKKLVTHSTHSTWIRTLVTNYMNHSSHLHPS